MDGIAASGLDSGLDHRCEGGDYRILAATGGLEVDVGVAAKKILVLDKLSASGRAKTVFLSKDKTGAIRKDVGTPPTTGCAGFCG